MPGTICFYARARQREFCVEYRGRAHSSIQSVPQLCHRERARSAIRQTRAGNAETVEAVDDRAEVH